MNNVNVDELVEIYDLQPHPEGGYFKEIYRSNGSIPSSVLPRHGGSRCFATDIFFLLPEGAISKLHRIRSDEMWHFYLGGPLTIVEISPDGAVLHTILGQDIKNGNKLQHVVPAGHWFGAYPNAGSEFSLVGCTVVPGFDFNDFEMGERSRLLKEFPKAKDMIVRLTK